MVRGQRVLMDSDLAELYGVETRILNQAIKRNQDRFPVDFMFQLDQEAFSNLKSQIVISSWGGRRKLPLVFTEHGAIMAASVPQPAAQAMPQAIMAVPSTPAPCASPWPPRS